jgi:hypothetical protein
MTRRLWRRFWPSQFENDAVVAELCAFGMGGEARLRGGTRKEMRGEAGRRMEGEWESWRVPKYIRGLAVPTTPAIAGGRVSGGGHGLSRLATSCSV